MVHHDEFLRDVDNVEATIYFAAGRYIASGHELKGTICCDSVVLIIRVLASHQNFAAEF